MPRPHGGRPRTRPGRVLTDKAYGSRAKRANLPGISAFFDAISELLSAEEGELADSSPATEGRA